MTHQALHTYLLSRFPGCDIEYTYPAFLRREDEVHEVGFCVVRPGRDEFTPDHCEGEFAAFVNGDDVELVHT
jgi:hypothetical protein